MSTRIKIFTTLLLALGLCGTAAAQQPSQINGQRIVSNTLPLTAISHAGASSGNVVTYNGSSIIWSTPAGSGLTITDGTNTVAGATQLTFNQGTVGGTSPNATYTLPAINLAASGAGGVTGKLPVANGGTGQSSYTDGQLLVGDSSSGGLDKATLTAGSNVTITNGHGTITIAASGGGGGLSADPAFIDGLQPSWVSASAVHVNQGQAWVPAANSGAGGIVSYPGGTISGSSFPLASTIYYVFLTPTGGFSIQSNPTLNSYLGGNSAPWSDNSGNRYLFSVLTSSSTNVVQFTWANGRYLYEANTNGLPFRVLSGGTATSATTVSVASVVPSTAPVTILQINETTAGPISLGNSNVVPTSTSGLFSQAAGGVGTNCSVDLQTVTTGAVNNNFQYITVSPAVVNLNVLGYIDTR